MISPSPRPFRASSDRRPPIGTRPSPELGSVRYVARRMTWAGARAGQSTLYARLSATGRQLGGFKSPTHDGATSVYVQQRLGRRSMHLLPLRAKALIRPIAPPAAAAGVAARAGARAQGLTPERGGAGFYSRGLKNDREASPDTIFFRLRLLSTHHLFVTFN